MAALWGISCDPPHGAHFDARGCLRMGTGFWGGVDVVSAMINGLV